MTQVIDQLRKDYPNTQKNHHHHYHSDNCMYFSSFVCILELKATSALLLGRRKWPQWIWIQWFVFNVNKITFYAWWFGCCQDRIQDASERKKEVGWERAHCKVSNKKNQQQWKSQKPKYHICIDQKMEQPFIYCLFALSWGRIEKKCPIYGQLVNWSVK